MQRYGEQYVSRHGPIPAHLLGNMWSQSWGEIYDVAIPYPGRTSVDVTPQMVTQVSYAVILPNLSSSGVFFRRARTELKYQIRHRN